MTERIKHPEGAGDKLFNVLLDATVKFQNENHISFDQLHAAIHTFATKMEAQYRTYEAAGWLETYQVYQGGKNPSD